MSGLKNMLPKGSLGEANFIAIRKRSEEYKKTFMNFIDHLQLINHIYINYYTAFEENMQLLVADIQKDNFNQKVYKEIINIFKNFNKELRIFIEKESIQEKPMMQIPDIFMTDYNLLLQTFQAKAKDYASNQLNLSEMCNRYFKNYKQMFLNIEQYKKSFVDVKLIYNKDEKIKLYNECSQIYINLLEENSLIEQKVEELNRSKQSLSDSYRTLEKQLSNFSVSFGLRYIDQIKKHVYNLIELNVNKLNHTIDRLLFVQQIAPSSFFIMNFNVKYQEHIAKEISIQECKYIPSFLMYSSYLSREGRILFKKMVLYYFQEITIKAQKRKTANKRFLDFISRYSKTYDKYIVEPYKQLLVHSQKNRKKISDIFGHKWLYFYKVISLLFENNIQNHMRFCSRTQSKIKNIESLILQQQNTLDNFCKEFKHFIEKHISKKIVKKYLHYEQKGEKMEEGLLAEQKQTTAQQISDGARTLTELILKLQETNSKHDELIKEGYISFMSDIKNGLGQYTAFCNEIKVNQYQEKVFFTEYRLCEAQIDASVKRQLRFFQEIQLGVLFKDNHKMSFDGEINKLQGFKKLKKPKELEEQFKNGIKNISNISFENSAQVSGDALVTSEKETGVQQQKMKKQEDKVKRQQRRKMFLGQIVSKNGDFLSTKIVFYASEKYVKSYSCALSDKVLLTGRLFITSHRLVFYSKFNRNTVFFGETFIEIPKNDIKKIQKRNSTFFFNNSLSITTVNGELLFASLMSRNETYDYIKSTFEINTEQIYFQQQNQNEHEQQVQINLSFQDDMKEEAGKERQIVLSKKIIQFQYQTVLEVEYDCPGLNVVKFVKLFQLDQEIHINRTAYSSFLYYIKDKQQHRNISIEPWTPNPLDHCNINNIKEGSPELYLKKVVADVPLPASNIPFMPKSALTLEEHSLYLLNKNKYIMEAVVKTAGIPYCDAYDLRIKKTVVQQEQNKVKMTVELFVNFNQRVMVKSTIESKAFDGSKDTYQRISQQIKFYLKTLEKKMQKSTKKETAQDKMRQLGQQMGQAQNQLKELKQVKKECERVISQQKQLLKMKNLVIICLAVVIFIEFLIIVT